MRSSQVTNFAIFRKMAARVPKENKVEQKCAGCTQNLHTSEHLICMQCNCRYDLECANIPRAFFKTSMTIEQKKTWKCQGCRCKMPKLSNTDTPVRSQSMILQQVITSYEDNNITIRKPKIHPNLSDKIFRKKFVRRHTPNT